MDLPLSSAEQSALFAAFDRSHGIIVFDRDGTILSANDVFLTMMGYGREIIGRKHSMFVHPSDQNGYERFWDRLRGGGFHSGDFRRLAAHGREVWLNAAYKALADDEGKVIKIIKVARDVTQERQRTVAMESEIRAIHRSHAVIEFDMRGTILHANTNFLNLSGYRLNEVVGKHHSILVTPEEAQSNSYREFWRELAQGRCHAGEFERIGKGGRHFWIRASYSPIVDLDGKTTGVIKYALDITEDVKRIRAHEDAMAASEALLQRVLDKVGGIAGNIEAITRQTRLLALNARIEAARVGDAGRSFAVVASEISGLSGRTADATSEIGKLILEGDQQSRQVSSLFGAAREQDHDAALALRAARG